MAEIPFKVLYKFDVFTEKEIEKEEVVTNEDGSTTKTTKKIKTSVPTTVVIRKPTRKDIDYSELHYGVELAKGIKEGLLTRSQVSKRYVDDDGILAEKEKRYYSNVYVQLYDAEVELQKSLLSKSEVITDEEKDKIGGLISKITSLKQEIQNVENQQQEIFSHTAENRARTKVIIWYLLNCSYFINDKGDAQPLFGAGNLEEKYEKYYDLEENGDDFYYSAGRKLAYFISYYYSAGIATTEEFKKLEDEIDGKNKSPEVAK